MPKELTEEEQEELLKYTFQRMSGTLAIEDRTRWADLEARARFFGAVRGVHFALEVFRQANKTNQEI